MGRGSGRGESTDAQGQGPQAAGGALRPGALEEGTHEQGPSDDFEGPIVYRNKFMVVTARDLREEAARQREECSGTEQPADAECDTSHHLVGTGR